MKLIDEVMKGNWLSFMGHFFCADVSDMINLDSGRSNLYEPISLSTETLEKRMGFIYDREQMSWTCPNTGITLRTREEGGFYYARLPSVTFKHVHTFQNFHRILTGKDIIFTT